MAETTPSIIRMPMFVAYAIGASLCPKHTGHASAARGTASVRTVISAFFMSLEVPCFPLKGGAIDGHHAARDQRADSSESVQHFVLELVLTAGPRGEEGRQHDGQRDEQQVKGSQRHLSALPRRGARRQSILRALRVCQWYP